MNKVLADGSDVQIKGPFCAVSSCFMCCLFNRCVGSVFCPHGGAVSSSAATLSDQKKETHAFIHIFIVQNKL